MFVFRPITSDIKEYSDNWAVTESRIKTSAADALIEEAVSGPHGDTPHTVISPLFFKSLARVSRSNLFPATRNAEGELLVILPPGTRLGYRNRHSLITD